MTPNLDSLSPQQVLVLARILSASKLRRIDLVGARYRREAGYFEATMTFLEDLGFIETISGEIVPMGAYARFVDRVADMADAKSRTEELVLGSLAKCALWLSRDIAEFLACFSLSDGQYKWAPSRRQRREWATVRDFLMSFGLLHADPMNGAYVIAAEREHIRKKLLESCRTRPEAFAALLLNRETMGRQAELEVLKYERGRLACRPDLLARIRHTSLEDTGAGYDIESCEGGDVGQVSEATRLIEVKAVSIWDYRFYWTTNEIRTARLRDQSYWLYLVPTIGGHRFRMDALKAIRAPYSTIYRDTQTWSRAVEVMSFSTAHGL